MNYKEDNIFKGVLVGKRNVFDDDRGWFSEVYDGGWDDLPFSFYKDSVSKSQQGVLRGLHFQNPHPQGKLVTVLQGTVIDFIVDIRKESETFGMWCGYELSDVNGVSLYVPEGFAHGFYVTSEVDAVFQYKCTDAYYPEAEQCLNFFDPEINIDFNFGPIIANQKDLQGKRLKDFKKEELF